MPIELTCIICNTKFFVRPSRIKKGAKYCNYTCHQIGEGRKGGQSRALQMKAKSQGKAYIKKNNRHLHRQIAEKKLGRLLNDKEIVHHIDGNILNNSFENIEVLKNQSEHIKIHLPEMLKKRKQKHGY